MARNPPLLLPERSPLARIVQTGLIGFGATMIVSAIVNAIAACELIEAADELSLGLTRGEILGWYGFLFTAGLLLIGSGLALRLRSVRQTAERTG